MQFLMDTMNVTFGFHPVTLMTLVHTAVAGVFLAAILLLLLTIGYIIWVRRKYAHLPIPPVPRYVHK